MLNTNTTVTAEGLGNLLGISATAVAGLARRGIIVRTERGRYDVVASVPRYCAHLREQAAGRGGAAGLTKLATERARLARLQGDVQELKAKGLRGELVEASAVEAEWSNVLRTVRAGVLAVPSRCAQRMPHLTVHDVGQIDSEVRDLLTALVTGFAPSG